MEGSGDSEFVSGPLPYVVVDVFTTTRFAGNPLAIVQVPPGRELPTEQMQTIANEFNLSETVFLGPRQRRPTGDDGVPEWRVRIFTVDRELPFAGHPTIGTACHALGALAAPPHAPAEPHGRLLCPAGPIAVALSPSAPNTPPRVRAAIPHHIHIHTQHPVTAADLGALQPGLAALPPPPAALALVRPPPALALVSPVRGLTFLCARLPDLAALGRVAAATGGAPPAGVRRDAGWHDGLLAAYFYVVLAEGDDAGAVVRLRARMVQEAVEDAATGSAACALAAFLALTWRRARTVRFEITQGVEMGRRSEMGVVVTLGKGLDVVETIELSGSAVMVMRGSIEG